MKLTKQNWHFRTNAAMTVQMLLKCFTIWFTQHTQRNEPLRPILVAGDQATLGALPCITDIEMMPEIATCGKASLLREFGEIGFKGSFIKRAFDDAAVIK